jgi:RNA polymerase sigma-70 factor (ECF subfamily)
MTPDPPSDHPEEEGAPPPPERERDTPPELEAMLRRAADGDQHAWREIVNTYSPRVFGLLRAQCHSADLAEEITQSTFCTIVAKIGGYTELGKFEAWIFRIAMNRLRDEMRRRKRQARVMESEALGSMTGRLPRAAQSPDEPVEPGELAALRVAITRLSEADQMIIHLRHYGGLSFKQIAEILDQPLGTVLARQHRALKKLAEILGPALGRAGPDQSAESK